MKITYIEHSGYAIEWESCIWVFDYYRGKIPDWEKTKPLIIFASHAHKDHFAPEIFSLFKEFEHVTYLLSTDIRKKIKRMSLDEKVLAQIRYATPGEQLSLPVSEGKEILVNVFDSTDCGVSFLVTYEERKIFHAGDLNCWIWEEESKAERNSMLAQYQREIQKLPENLIDCAFLPVDYRLGASYDYGARYFLEHVKVSHVFPMHLWGRYSIVETFRNSFRDPKEREKIVSVKQAGQQWEFGVVTEIVEPDFGCEGRPDEGKVKDQVFVQLENGEKRLLEIEDQELYERGIDEGSSLLIERGKE